MPLPSSVDFALSWHDNECVNTEPSREAKGWTGNFYLVHICFFLSNQWILITYIKKTQSFYFICLQTCVCRYVCIFTAFTMLYLHSHSLHVCISVCFFVYSSCSFLGKGKISFSKRHANILKKRTQWQAVVEYGESEGMSLGSDTFPFSLSLPACLPAWQTKKGSGA